MLRKLIKYDLKSMSRLLIIIHVFLLLAAVAVRVFFTERFNLVHIEGGAYLALAFILFSLFASGVSLATEILIAIRFYKNLFSNEGYLTHTLPATRGQHLAAKTVAGGLWLFLDQVLLFVSLFFVIATSDVVDLYWENKDAFLTELGLAGMNLPAAKIILFILLFSLINAVSSAIMIYASIVVGQRFQSHPVLGAVVSYLGISTIFAIISVAILSVFGFFSFVFEESEAMAGVNAANHVVSTLNISMVLSLAAAVILYIITQILMRKKLDLA